MCIHRGCSCPCRDQESVVNSKRHTRPPETLEGLIHLLAKLQSEGWSLSKFQQSFESRRLHGKGPKIIVGSELHIHLDPPD